MDLANKTEKEIREDTENISGEIFIGSGEMEAFRLLASVMKDFSQKYRYADEAQEVKLGKFISKLDFVQPGQLAIKEVCLYPHKNVYLCFLMGTEALFQIFIFGKYDDILRDYDEWEVFSPCLLLVDEDFIHYTYINDDGEVMESQVS